MSTTTIAAGLPATRTRTDWRPRLVSAEFLKLRKRSGLVLSALMLSVLPMVIGYTVLLSMHAANPDKHGPAGGLENLSGSMGILSVLSVVAAILVGATLGAADLGSGVFRELVVTGRSRGALFAARVPAGLGLVLPIVGAGFAVTATCSTLFAGSLDAPSARLLLESAAWLALVTAVSLVLALGSLRWSARAGRRSGSRSAGRSSPRRSCSRSGCSGLSAKGSSAQRPSASRLPRSSKATPRCRCRSPRPLS